VDTPDTSAAAQVAADQGAALGSGALNGFTDSGMGDRRDGSAGPRSAPPACEPPEPLPEGFVPFSPCVETTHVVGNDFKAPWGTTPRDVMKLASGTHKTSLTWQRENGFSYGVEGTSTTVRVEITRRGPATFFKRDGSINIPPGNGNRPFFGHPCRSLLLIPVTVKVATSDGVIDVEAEAALQMSSRDDLSLFMMQPLASHRGSLRIREIREEGLQVCDFGVTLDFPPKALWVGTIGGSYPTTSGGLFVEYARFRQTPQPARK
jgi:hypothetical protein